MNESRIFVEKITDIIKSKKMKLGDVEKIVGVSPGYLSRIKIVNNEIGLDKAMALCRAVGMSYEEVMKWEPEFDFEWQNDKFFVKKNDRTVCTITKEQLREAFKTPNPLNEALDKLLGKCDKDENKGTKE